MPTDEVLALAWGMSAAGQKPTLRSCWPPEHDLTARRNHLADRAPTDNEEHRKTRRRQDQLEGQRRHRPMNVDDLGGDCEASKNSDVILKGNLSLAAC
jgi:hypothetical protein